MREGETGSLVPSGDVDALADELTRFAALPDSRLAAMGAAGRAWVERDFTESAYRDRLVALYSTLSPGVAA